MSSTMNAQSAFSHPLFEEAETHRRHALYHKAFDSYLRVYHAMNGDAPEVVVEHLFTHAVLSGRLDAVCRAMDIRHAGVFDRPVEDATLQMFVNDMDMLAEHGFQPLAIASIERFLHRYPGHFRLSMLLSRLYLKSGDPSRASAVAGRALLR